MPKSAHFQKWELYLEYFLDKKSILVLVEFLIEYYYKKKIIPTLNSASRELSRDPLWS